MIRFRRRLGRANRRKRLPARDRDNRDKPNAAQITQKPRKIAKPGKQRCIAELQQKPQGAGIQATIAQPSVSAQGESWRDNEPQGEIPGCQGDVPSNGERGNRQTCPFQAERS